MVFGDKFRVVNADGKNKGDSKVKADRVDVAAIKDKFGELNVYDFLRSTIA